MSITNEQSKYEILFEWLKLHGKTPNPDKLKRQVVGISKWQSNGCIGAIQAVTAFGKTWLALCSMYLIQRVNPDYTFNIIVPSEKLFKDWNDHIREFGIKNSKVFIINSYTKKEFWTNSWYCNGLIIDEGHRCLGEESIYFSKVIQITKYNSLLLMSATLDDREKAKLRELNIPIVDTVSMLEAKKMGFISDYKIYNYGVRLSEEDQLTYNRIHKLHNDMFAKFQFFDNFDSNYKLATACSIANDKYMKVGTTTMTGKAWKEWYAEQQLWDGTKDHDWSPTNIGKYASQWSLAVIKRKNFLYKHPKKIEAAVEVAKFLNAPTITFSETTDVADKLKELLGEKAVAYHSNIQTLTRTVEETSKPYKKRESAVAFKNKVNGSIITTDNDEFVVVYKREIKISGKNLKRLILSEFEKGHYQYICTAKALDEGYNVEGIRVALVISATSKQRQTIQRNGRAIRFVPGKQATIVNFYLIDTKDEDWIETRQKGETNIKWISSIEEIDLI